MAEVTEVGGRGGTATAGRVVVTELVKQYRGMRAVDGLSFVVEPGRVTGFLGPNGAGKTTTLRMILGLVAPTAGMATIGGSRYVDLADPLRVVGAVLDAGGAHAGRSGRDHLRVIAMSAGIAAWRVEELVERVGLAAAASRAFGGYSLGMRQRLGIAAALLGDPQVLVLDEPANGLDPEGIVWMRGLLRGLADEGRTVLVSSHLLSEMQLLADDVVIIAAGRLVTAGTVAEVLDSLPDAGWVRVRTPQAEILGTVVGAAGGALEPVGGGTLRVTGLSAPEVGRIALVAGVELHELVAERPDLEQAFVNLTAGRAEIR